MLKEIQRRLYKVDISFLVKNFGVSYPAAEHRIETLNRNIYLTREEKLFDDIILEKFKRFINKIAPEKCRYSSYTCWDDPMQKERDSWT